SGHVYRTVIGALPLTGVLSGKLSSGSFAGAVEVGWKQRLELMDVTPFLAVSLQSVDQKAFTEQPSSAAVAPLALHFDKRNSTSVPLSLGIQVAETLRLDDRTTLNPMVRVAWVHEFDPDRAAMAQFAVLPAFGFAVAGARAMEDAARIDAGLQLEIGGGASVLVGGTITASGAGSSAGGEFVVRLALYAIRRSRSSTPCRMYAAAILSTTSLRRLRDASASMRVRVTAAVDSRSSHNRIGRAGARAAKLRAKARADCADGPSLPSMLSGRPTTIPPTPCAATIASSLAASAVNLPRASVSIGVATVSSVSESAIPMVFSPRSRPRSLARSGRAALK